IASPSAIWCVGVHSGAWDAAGGDSDAADAADSPVETAGAALSAALGWTLGVVVASGWLGIKSLSSGPILA
ncbi:MAG TPA: hypothetical protein VFS96_07745, partial [Nitrolancea sp.]|nr:hypothetical protein [Nitrolancea sp.]